MAVRIIRAAFPGWIITYAGMEARRPWTRVVPSTVYIGCATGFPVNASYQNGAAGTFSPAVNGIDPTDPSDFIPPLATDPNTANVLYFGTHEDLPVLRCGKHMDRAHWAAGLRSRRLADSNRGRAGKFQRRLHRIKRRGSFCHSSRHHESAFFQVGEFPIAPRAVTGIAVDPADPTGNTAYVALSGFSVQRHRSARQHSDRSRGHIFKTANANIDATRDSSRT